MLILYGNANAWLCWCPGRCGCILSLLPGDDSCMTAGHRETHRAMLGEEGCYKVSPSHTHKQDTITDTQCGCPFVWFIGDVVANVASVSLRGSGRLQIFPSQQEVQIWKKVRKQRVSRARLSQKEAGHQKERYTSWQMRSLFYKSNGAWHSGGARTASHLEATCSIHMKNFSLHFREPMLRFWHLICPNC